MLVLMLVPRWAGDDASASAGAGAGAAVLRCWCWFILGRCGCGVLPPDAGAGCWALDCWARGRGAAGRRGAGLLTRALARYGALHRDKCYQGSDRALWVRVDSRLTRQTNARACSQSVPCV